MTNMKNARTTRTTRTTALRHDESCELESERSTGHQVYGDTPSDSIAPESRQAPKRPRQRSPGDPAKHPNDWVVACFSAAPNELAAIDAVVEKFRAAGIRKMSRSRLIRIAVSKLDLDEVIASMRGAL